MKGLHKAENKIRQYDSTAWIKQTLEDVENLDKVRVRAQIKLQLIKDKERNGAEGEFKSFEI